MGTPTFIQAAPRLGNQFSEDRVLRGYLARVLTAEQLDSVSGALHRMGELAGVSSMPNNWPSSISNLPSFRGIPGATAWTESR